jgi:hypothetical protein
MESEHGERGERPGSFMKRRPSDISMSDGRAFPRRPSPTLAGAPQTHLREHSPASLHTKMRHSRPQVGVIGSELPHRGGHSGSRLLTGMRLGGPALAARGVCGTDWDTTPWLSGLSASAIRDEIGRRPQFQAAGPTAPFALGRFRALSTRWWRTRGSRGLVWARPTRPYLVGPTSCCGLAPRCSIAQVQ